MTNGDRIRAFDNKELARYLSRDRRCTLCACFNYCGIRDDICFKFSNCVKNLYDWLCEEESNVKER